MKALIIEDEYLAADRLISVLKEIDSTTEIIGQVDSVKSALKWFSENDQPEIAFFDIQLADGKSFEIFEKTTVTCPIIFTTAYDQYAIQAFKVNSVDYLLKPIAKQDLGKALEKFRSNSSKQAVNSQELLELLKQQSIKYKERFVVKIGDHLRSVMTTDSQVFYSQEKATYVHTKSGKKFILDFTLDQLEELLDPSIFFRISRKYIVHLDSFSDVIAFSNSRLKLIIENFNAQDLIVSRERVGAFKSWLDR